MSPVDSVAHAIVALLSESPGTFHLANARRSPTFSELGCWMAAAGLRVRGVPPAVFRSLVARPPRTRLTPLAAFLARPGVSSEAWPSPRTSERLACSRQPIAAIDAAAIERTIRFLERHGLIQR
jgi:hypothetical protein